MVVSGMFKICLFALADESLLKIISNRWPTVGRELQPKWPPTEPLCGPNQIVSHTLLPQHSFCTSNPHPQSATANDPASVQTSPLGIRSHRRRLRESYSR